MKIVLATGIYPPALGGPATYVRALAREFVRMGYDVSVITYDHHVGTEEDDGWDVFTVSKSGGPLMRWLRYAKVLRKRAADADIIYSFSTFSVGIPLFLSRLQGCERILRLGGDFLWERAVERGCTQTMDTYYAGKPLSRYFTRWILWCYDHLIYSTQFQHDLYAKYLPGLPASTVLENAFPYDGTLRPHLQHSPFQLLYLGRLVAFKNLPTLIEAVADIDDALLIIAGDGPKKSELKALVDEKGLEGKVFFVGAVHGQSKKDLLLQSDLLVLPSLNEISPNSALEARSEGLPVLLSKEQGLNEDMSHGMHLAELSTKEQIQEEIKYVRENYAHFGNICTVPLPERSWRKVAEEHRDLFVQLHPDA